MEFFFLHFCWILVSHFLTNIKLMNVASMNETTSSLHHSTYTAGEDKGRLAQAALSLGLNSHRMPKKNVRIMDTVVEMNLSSSDKNGGTFQNENANGLESVRRGLFGKVGLLFTDYTYERASMLSAGIYEDEELDDDGRIVIQPDDGQNQTIDLEAFMKGYGSNGFSKAERQLSVEDLHGGGHGGSLFAAVFGIIKAMVGPAILYLPHGFATSGYAFSISVVLIVTAMFLYSSDRLLDSWRSEIAKELNEIPQKDNKSYLTISDEMKPLTEPNSSQTRPRSFKKSKHVSYPELAYRVYGETGEQAVKTGIALMQLGVCLTYFIFVPQNLHTSLRVLYNVDAPMWACLFFMVIVEIPLSWIRDIRKLTLTNILANFLILYGLCSCIWLAIGTDVINDEQGDSFADELENLAPIKHGWIFFIGTTVLLFEGSITLCIPLQEAVDGKEQRKEFPRIYKKTILCIIAFYCAFAMICWTAFGDDVQTALTTSLPSGVLATSVQLAYSLAVIFTFPLQAYPALEIISRTVQPLISCSNQYNGTSKKLSSTSRNIISSITVLLLSIVAIVEMESLGHVVSLVGSLLGLPIAFVFPPLIHNRLVEDPSKWTWGRFFNYLVAGLGLSGMVFATFTTLASWNDVTEGR